MSLAIELTFRGMCVQCPYAELELTKTNTFTRGNDWFATCKHRQAGPRAADKCKDKEVSEGYWIENCTDYTCSACGGVVSDEIVYMLKSEGLPDYCPNCGAKMGGAE